MDPSQGTVQRTVKTVSKSCTGEDGGALGSYIRINQTLNGGSTDAFDGSPTPGDFSLTGALKSTAVLTLNTATGQGWGTGLITVTNATNIITGPVTVVIQADANLNIEARGTWVGTVKDLGGNPTGDISVQNFELTGNTTQFQGSWGGPASVPDLSVKTTRVRR